jgi:hypothetical protein
MENSEKNLSAQESLEIIQQMIMKTKSSLSDNSRYFLLWGWLSIFASIGDYLIIKFCFTNYHFLIWFMLPLIGIPISIYYSKKYNERVNSHLSDFISILWTGFGITSLIIFGLIFINYNFPILQIFLLFIGFCIFVTGRVIKFTPLTVGAIFCWICAIVCSFTYNMPEQLLIYAASIIVGYLIPGYILKNKYKKNNV